MAAKRRRRKRNSGNTSSLVVITLTTFLATVMIFAVGIKLLTSDNKKSPEVSSENLLRPVNSENVVSFDDDDEPDESSSDEVSSGEVSSISEHSAFEGTWKKTDVYESDKATLVISEQDDEGFRFKLTVWANGKSKSVSGNAEFAKKNIAIYKKGNASITFERGSKLLSVYHSGNNSTLGFDAAQTIDGKFTTGTPNYYKQEEANHYDGDVYKSKAITNALKTNLSAPDYDLYQRMIKEGLRSPIAYERTVDKNGNQINVDAELDAVKYYANLSDLGEDMILICRNNGMFYLVFYNSEEMIYYTNDAAYAKKLPTAFKVVAESKGITPTYK